MLSWFAINIYINIECLEVKNFKLKPSTLQIIVGNSQSVKGVNPILFSNTENIAKSGESMDLSIIKTTKILAENSQIKKVLFQFNAAQLPIINTLENNQRSRTAFNDYYDFIEFPPKWDNWGYSILFYIKKYGLYPRLKSSRNWMEGYRENSRKRISLKLNPIHHYFYDKDNEIASVSKTVLNRFEQFVLFCEKNKVELVIMQLPVEKGFFKNIPKELLKSYSKVILNHSEIKFINGMKCKAVDSLFTDPQHLNTKGATNFSIWLSQQLN